MSIVLFFIWIVLNGKWTLEIVSIGILLSVAITYFMHKYMEYKLMCNWKAVKIIGYSFLYAGVLVLEVVKANISVIKIVLSPTLHVEPLLFSYRPGLKSTTARVILANSITLTPGTITVKLEGDTYWIHCLSKEMAQGIDESQFLKILKKAEEYIYGDIC